MNNKPYLEKLFTSRFPTILQTESTECGLACVAMLANFHGHRVSLRELRLRFPVSLKGMALGSLLRVCKHNGLSSRPVRTNLAGLQQVRLPCILHWNFNHFVILTAIDQEHAWIVDPAHGERRIPLEHLSRSFTGVAIEVWPSEEFAQTKPQKRLPLWQIAGRLRRHKRAIGVVLLLALVVEILTAIAPYYIQLVIDSAVSANDRYIFAVLAAGFAGIYIFKNLTIAVRGWFLMYLGTSLNVQWKDNVLGHLLSLPLEFFEKRHVGDVMSRFGSIEAIQRMITTSFAESLLDGLFSGLIIIILITYQPMLGSIVLLSAALYFLFRWILNSRIIEATRDEIIQGAKQSSYLLETLRGVRQIKLYGQQDDRRLSWMVLFINQTNAKIATQKIEVTLKFVRTFTFDIQSIIVIWLGALLVIDQEYSLGALVAFLGYKVLFETRIATLIDNIFVIQNIQIQADRLSDIVLTQPETKSEPTCRPLLSLPASLECQEVYFQYSLFERNVIDGLDLHVEEGESVALIGPSGCGKSTLFNVILGIYEGAKGRILIGGEEAKTLGNENLRSLVGVVLQDDILFAGSIVENIAGFDNQVDFEWVMRCAELANISKEIDAMPMGYYTLVGDMGTVLSGGQKQRLMLARAFYKKPRILLLDEATSHLDVANERAVNQSIRSLNMTRIFIAHRPETVLSADRILLMDKGRIASTLTPAEAADYLQSMNEIQ
ncbi:peptidase domain-containing ABC transporter [Pseudomonas sp. COR18]|uniref:peptidase domain-containing ABC transporter n=1 Tax=Pseudomonas sp. COR18 TaxID=3399680 RepID=UPI003AFFD650